MDTSLPSPMTARVELLIYWRVLVGFRPRFLSGFDMVVPSKVTDSRSRLGLIDISIERLYHPGIWGVGSNIDVGDVGDDDAGWKQESRPALKCPIPF